jgi:KipI family sensor histidine kinase inhibitor
MTIEIEIETAGVNSLLLRFSDHVDNALISQISQFSQQLKSKLADHLIDLVPSYTTLLVSYDLLKIDEPSMREQIKQIAALLGDKAPESLGGRIIELPVCYDSNYAPDLEKLCGRLSLSADEIIRLHSQRVYQVYAIGFCPGFGYLGELDTQLQVPRLATPRTVVPRGSVAIAERNTAVYPQDTPGGWWLIGRCPLLMFDPAKEPPCLFTVGDRVRFVPISSAQYQRMEAER